MGKTLPSEYLKEEADEDRRAEARSTDERSEGSGRADRVRTAAGDDAPPPFGGKKGRRRRPSRETRRYTVTAIPFTRVPLLVVIGTRFLVTRSTNRYRSFDASR